MFDKYARAISDEKDRKTLHALYIAKNAALILMFVMVVSSLACMLALPETPETEIELEPPVFWAAVFSLLGFIIFGIAFLVLQIVFSSNMKKILKAPKQLEENSQVDSYREKYEKSSANDKKKNLPYLIVLIVCVVVSVALIVIDTVQNDTDGILTPMGIAALAVMCAGTTVFAFGLIYNQLKKTSEGGTFEQQTESEAAAIDAQQGRKPKYRLEADKNLNSYFYVFPDENLRLQAEAEKIKYNRSMFIGLIFGFAVGVAVCLIFLSGWVFKDANFVGYMMPALILCIFGVEFFAILSSVLKTNKIEKAQYAKLKENPEYADNLEIYNLYKHFAKTFGNSAFYSLIVAFLTSLGLAIAFPDKFYSMLAFFIVLIGLIINYRATVSLRKKCRPIEARIDAKNAPVQSNSDDI